jgi:spore germination protein YaaH
MPVPSGGSVNSNAYDYKSIGALVDKVILMAHDYDPRDLSAYVNSPGDTPRYYQHCPTVPLYRVFLDLRDVVELVDPSKVALAFSARSIAWQIDSDNKLVSGTPVSVAADTVAKRLAQSDTVLGWDDTYQQSYAIYTTEDGSRYWLWYQNEASVEAELRMARLLGVTGVSLWRLGTIPAYSGWSWSGLLT